MNVGQVLETHLAGLARSWTKVVTPVFDGISESRVRKYLEEAGLPSTGKSILYDGQTRTSHQEVVVGYMYAETQSPGRF